MWVIDLEKLEMAGISAVLMGGCGGAVALAIDNATGMTPGNAFFTVATAGAALAGALVSPMLGGAGRTGWGLGLLGGLLATLVGSLLAVMMLGGIDIYSASIGPLFVFAAMLENPEVLLTWVACMSTIHLALRRRC